MHMPLFLMFNQTGKDDIPDGRLQYPHQESIVDRRFEGLNSADKCMFFLHTTGVEHSQSYVCDCECMRFWSCDSLCAFKHVSTYHVVSLNVCVHKKQWV